MTTPTTKNGNSLHLTVRGGRAWKDLFVVVYLTVVLGAFVAQIASSPRHASPQPIAAATAETTAQG